MKSLGDDLARHLRILHEGVGETNSAATDLNILLQSFLDDVKHTDLQQSIIDSLYCFEIGTRESALSATHPATFQWIFNRDRANLLEWLENGDGVYWVAGKAGSGKSTLMKYVSEHVITQQALKMWAKEKALVTASIFC